MKKTGLLSFVLFSLCAAVYGQKPTPTQFIGERVPQYMGSGTSSRLPVLFKGNIVGLSANTRYKYFVTLIDITDTSSSTYNGAGSPMFLKPGGTWRYNATPSLSNPSGHDTITSTMTGEFRSWFGVVYDGDTRFTAGNYVYPLIVMEDVLTTTVQKFIMMDSIHVLAFSTSSGANNGTAVYGKSYTKSKAIISLFDNPAIFSRPLAITYSENEGITVSNTDAYYTNNVNGVTGSWGAVLPNTLSNGMRMIESFDPAGDTSYYANRDRDGVWAGVNTVNPSGGLSTPLLITATAAPLVKPEVQFAARFGTTNEGAGTAEVYVKCKYCNDDTTKVTVSVISGSATNGTDYNFPVSQVRAFRLNGDQTDTLKITLNEDMISEGDETIILKLSDVKNGMLGLEETHTLTIKDNEVPLFTFAKPEITVKEDDGFAKVKVRVNNGPSMATDVRVFVKRTGDSTNIPAEFRIGFSNRDTTIQFPGASKVQDSLEFRARVFKDNKVDPSDTIVLVLRSPSNGGIIGADSLCTIIVKDIDLPPGLSFSSTGISVKESAGNVKLRLNITGTNAKQSDFTLKYVPAASSASQGSDFSFSPTSQPFTFNSLTDPDSIIVDVPVIDDDVFEANETAVFVITNMSNTRILKPDTFRIRIINDDLPVYAVSKVTSVNSTSGVADSLNVKCKVRGVVYGINMRPVGTPAGFQFTLIDPTGGIQVFSPAGNKNYTVTEGDSITAVGVINQFNGMIQIGSLDTIIKHINNKPLKAPLAVTALDETTESEFVKLNMVRLVDASQWPSTPMATNTTKDVEVRNATTTFTITIDSDTDIDGTPAPDGFMNITGIGGQFDPSSPYTSGYVLFPRSLSDIQEVSTPHIKFTTTSQTVNERFSDSTNAITVSATGLTNTITVRVVVKGGNAQNPRDYQYAFPAIVTLSPAAPSYSFKIDLNDDVDADGLATLVLALRNNPYGSIIDADSVHTISINDDETMNVKDIDASKVSVYPNPSEGSLNIGAAETILSVRVISVTGQTVAVKDHVNDTRTAMNLQDLATGVYTLDISTVKGSVMKKITINK